MNKDNDSLLPVPQSLYGWLTFLALAVAGYLIAYLLVYPRLISWQDSLGKLSSSALYWINLQGSEEAVYGLLRAMPAYSWFDTSEVIVKFSRDPEMLEREVATDKKAAGQNSKGGPCQAKGFTAPDVPVHLRFRLTAAGESEGKTVWVCESGGSMEMCNPKSWIEVDIPTDSVVTKRLEVIAYESHIVKETSSLALSLLPDAEWSTADTGSGGDQWSKADVGPCIGSRDVRLHYSDLQMLLYSITRKLLLPPWGNGVLLLLLLVVNRYLFEEGKWQTNVLEIISQILKLPAWIFGKVWEMIKKGGGGCTAKRLRTVWGVGKKMWRG